MEGSLQKFCGVQQQRLNSFQKKRKARKCKQRDYLNVLFDTDQNFESCITTRFNCGIQAYKKGETD